MCCSTAITTCSRRIRSSCGKPNPSRRTLPMGKDGKDIVARGASDDKGQLMTFRRSLPRLRGEWRPALPTSRFCSRAKRRPARRRCPAFSPRNKDELSAPDLALVCDTSMWNASTPAITMMLRGLALEEVIIKGPSHDLHSGMFGGPVLQSDSCAGENHRRSARHRGQGDAAGLLRRRRRSCPRTSPSNGARIDFDESKWLSEIGLSRVGGEIGRGVIEQIWSRPTCDVNGIVGGYTGAGLEDGAAGAGQREILVPSRRQAGRESDSRELPRLRARAPAGATQRSNSSRMARRPRCSFRSVRRR